MFKRIFILATVVGLSTILSGQERQIAKAKRHLKAQSAAWSVTVDDVSSSSISDIYTSDEGHTYIYFHQEKDGIPIYGAVTPVVVSKSGIVHSTGHRFIPNLASIATRRSVAISPQEALMKAVEELGLSTETPLNLRNSGDMFVIEKSDFANNKIEISKQYVYEGGELKLGWSMDIDEKEDADYYNIIVDANDGLILEKYNYTLYCTFDHNHTSSCGHHAPSSSPVVQEQKETVASSARYNVFAYPVESPIHGERSIEVDPHVVEASPYGWHDTDGVEGAEYRITRGNNVHAYQDLNDVNASSGTEPNGGAELNFDFPFENQADATSHDKLSQVNLFYAVNRLHDVMYMLGFDEKSGNFQINNYGKGGTGNDAVQAESFDGFGLQEKKLNNANFSTPPDGRSGRMQMFLWDNPTASISIDSPEEEKGFITEYGTSTTFGTSIPKAGEAPIKGKVVLAYDASAQDASAGCKEIANKDEVNGHIAMVDRGLCFFTEKAENAQRAGAIALIICNIAGAGGDGEEVIGMSGENEFVKIPAVMFKKSDCDRIKATIRGGRDVEMTFQERDGSSKKYLDGSLDNGVVAHEFGHGVSIRLVGGPRNSTCLTSEEQAGEGISDFVTLLMTVKEGDTRNDPKGIGNYVDAKPATGKGIRRYPYTSDMTVDPSTFGDLKSIDTSRDGFIYSVGSVWTSMLWEVFWNIVDEKGLDSSWKNKDSGNFIAGRLFIEGMKMSPCNPSFIEARNAILEADKMLYDGAYNLHIWKGFAKRGLGFYASDTGSDSIGDSEENFEVDPLSVKELKIKKTMVNVVKAGQEVEVTLTVHNHIEKSVVDVKVEDQIPGSMVYVDGSSDTAVEIVDGKLVFSIGDMAYKAERVIKYKLRAEGEANSPTLYYQNFDDFDSGTWDQDVLEGASLWRLQDDFSYSPDYSWYIEESTEEIDVTLVTEALQIVGERPVLKFWHQFDTEPVNDGGFVQISTDDRKTWTTVPAASFLRNGYNTRIDYSTFAIPSLEGYTGSSKSKFIDSYIDLSDYKGKAIHVRFRFGTNEGTVANAEYPGWAIDDLEIVDLKAEGSIACVSASNVEKNACTSSHDIIFESTSILSTIDLKNGVEAFEVAPNPASQYITVKLHTSVHTQGDIQLVNALGQVIQSIAVETKNHPLTRSFDVSELTPGIYIVNYRFGDSVITEKVVINR